MAESKAGVAAKKGVKKVGHDDDRECWVCGAVYTDENIQECSCGCQGTLYQYSIRHPVAKPKKQKYKQKVKEVVS